MKASRLLGPQGTLAGRALVGTGASLVAIALFVPWYDPIVMMFENWAEPFLGVQIAFLGPFLAGEAVLMGVALAMNRRPSLALVASLAVLATAGVFLLLQDSLYDATWVLWKGVLRGPNVWRLGPGVFVAIAGGGLALLGALIVWRRKSPTTTAAGRPPSAPA